MTTIAAITTGPTFRSISITLTNQQVQSLIAAQDQAATKFWAYPPREWQVAFQSQWLVETIGATSATDEHGLLWGEDPIP